MQSAINALAFPAPDRAYASSVLRKRSDLVLLQTASGETTACVHVHSRTKRHQKITILYSHANAEDLGLALPFVEALARHVGADVLAYEYPGYSLASGSPSEKGCLECIDAAYLYLTRDCGLAPAQIIAYGRSIGSGPTVDLCSRHALGGMVLQSPIASAGSVVLPALVARSLANFDIFRNYEKVAHVTCRALLMHGRADTMVPFAHSHEILYPLLRDPPPSIMAGRVRPPRHARRRVPTRRGGLRGLRRGPDKTNRGAAYFERRLAPPVGAVFLILEVV